MPRRRPAQAEAPPAPPPHVIQPTAVYTVEQLQAALGLARSTVRTERRMGRLRVAKRAGRYYVLGAWLLEWLQAGELKRRAALKATADDQPAA
jgi:hypothetical protein